MSKITEVELKVRVSEKEFMGFIDTNKYFKMEQNNCICIKEDTYWKNKSVNTNSFIRLRCNKTAKVGPISADTDSNLLWKYLNLGRLQDMDAILSKGYDSVFITCKTKNVDENGIETNEEQEASLNCQNPKEFMDALAVTNGTEKWFTKTKYSAKFIVYSTSEHDESDHINLEFVHVDGVDGVFAEIEYVNPDGIDENELSETADWLKTILVEIGFNDTKIEPRSWREMLGL